jgi:tRNA(adenine34) deaminase
VTAVYRAAFEPAMRAALAEAVQPSGPPAEVPVGAVVLDPAGTIIARAHNRREADTDPTAHAEIVAIRQAARETGGWRLVGCTLIVTLEPCTMCAGAITAARIERLVYGAPDPEAGAAGSLWDVLRDRRLGHRTEVIGGVLADECGNLLRQFFARQRQAWPSRAAVRRDASQGGGGAHSGATGDDDNAARRPPADAQQAEDPRDTS